MTVLVESEVFDAGSGPPSDWGETVFRYCTFEGLEIDGLSFDGELHSSTLRGLDLYWAFFNTAVVVESRVEDCIFRGASFRGCHFVATTFVGCRFELDNLGGITSFHDTTLTECTFERCRLAHRTDRGEGEGSNHFEAVRAYACQLTDCTGFEGLPATTTAPTAGRGHGDGQRARKRKD